MLIYLSLRGTCIYSNSFVPIQYVQMGIKTIISPTVLTLLELKDKFSSSSQIE